MGSTESRAPPRPRRTTARRTTPTRELERGSLSERAREAAAGSGGPLSAAGPRGGRLSLDRRPGLVDPGVRRRGLAFGPAGRGRDAPDRDRDDAARIQDRERILRHVLAEADERVLVPLVVVGTDVDVAGGAGHHPALEHRDDRVVLGPAADELV